MKGRPKTFDPAKYGFTFAEWEQLSVQERNRAQSKLSKAKKPQDQLRACNRSYAKKSYWKHRDRQLARCRARWAKVGSINTIRHSPDQIYRAVVAAIPKGMPRFARDDIAGEICLAVLEGKVLAKNILPEVSRYVTAYNRQYDTFKTISLDAPIAGTDAKLIDVLSYDEGTGCSSIEQSL